MLRFTTPSQHTLGIASLKREFRALEKFHHAYIVELVGVVVDDPTYCLLLMELAPLGSLNQVHGTRSRSTLHPCLTLATWWDMLQVLEETPERITSSQETQLVLALHIASAMAFLHRQMPPVLHHDLKTANVLLWDQPVFVAKICDFGLVTGTGESTVTAVGGGRGGTLHYKPPESFQGKPFTTASEVYSYGIVLWEMLTAQKPWAGMQDAAVMHKVINNGRPPVGSDIKRTALARLAKRCWAQRPSARPAFAVLETTLQAALQELVRTRIPKNAIFLSYRVAADADLVERLHDKLSVQGLTVWWDKKCLQQG